MPAGLYPRAYLHNPDVQKPLEEIYADLDAYTGELLTGDANVDKWCELRIVLPPLWYRGRFVKGLYFSQSVDFLVERFPRIPELFYSMAFSASAAYPWSRAADVLLTGFENADRDASFRRRHPERAHQILCGSVSGESHLHEYGFAPPLFPKRDIDLLCVAQLAACKNIPMIAAALRDFRAQYDRPICLTLITGKDFDINLDALTPSERKEWRKIEKLLTHPADYITLLPKVPHNDMPGYYSRAKLFVLGSLMEGWNRSLHEALACDTPVVCFEHFNHWIRGGVPWFPPEAGLTVPEFTPEALADTLHQAYENLDRFQPREAFLKRWGRKRNFNRLLASLAHEYERQIPDFHTGEPYSNLWLDLAMQANYQISLHDFIYDRNRTLSHPFGVEGVEKTVAFYAGRKDYFDRVGLAASNRDSSW